jgi:plastocyanin
MMIQTLLFFSLFLVFSTETSAQVNENEVFGKITFPTSPKVIKRGTGYNKDGTKVMHSNDPMANANRNIIVSLHPLSFKVDIKPMQNASITQKQQTFLPNVLPVTKGTTVYFLNEDEFFHNIYSLSPGSRFNIGRRPPGDPYPIKIKKNGVIKLSCDIHPHMYGTILSLDTPYFCRVDKNGKYSIKNLPDGSYELTIFHPEQKEISRKIQVSGDERKEINFDLKRP